MLYKHPLVVINIYRRQVGVNATYDVAEIIKCAIIDGARVAVTVYLNVGSIQLSYLTKIHQVNVQANGAKEN